VLEQDPEHTRALAALARLYESKEEWERCADVLKRAAATGRGGPDEAEVHFRLARLYQKQMGDEERAVKELDFAVQLNPAHVEANEALVAYCRKKGDYHGLLDALIRQEAVLEEKGERVAKLLEIAVLQGETLSDMVGAVSSLERARALVPDNTDVLLKLSDAYLAAGRQNDAIPVIEALVDAETQGGKKRSKQAAVYHQRLAQAYLGQGLQDKGLEHLEAAYKMDIANIPVLASLGQLHYTLENYDKAVKLFRALLLQRLDPSLGMSKADIYWYVGDIFLKQGDPRKAKGMFRRGLDEDSSHEACKTSLAEC
jgi:tetratricopeptide (TPR) repeat protein